METTQALHAAGLPIAEQMVLKIVGTPAEASYRGCGRAWLAVKDGVPQRIIYMGDHAIRDYDRIEHPDRRFKAGVRVEYRRRDTSAEFGEYRARSRAELSTLGEVVGGMCSCYEFVRFS